MKIHSKSNSLLLPALASAMATAGILLLALLAAIIHTPPVAEAVSARDFKPGNIISDAVFYDKNTMNAQQIQLFLNKQIQNCDTWGAGKSEYGGGTRAQYAASRGWHKPPYVCLNNYYENPNTGETSYEKGGGSFAGGVSAAEIIYRAAQKYNINPQVLLVLLKKESAGPLTSDAWPLKSQYKYAMGYACPDSGPGYSANCDDSKAGLYKQVELAAWQLKYYKDNPNDYRYKIGWNDIQYSPDPGCGMKRVYVENIATLSLYIYTPYTPNDASLANYPGTASCGAYGNRNFFMFFSEWFGSPSTGSTTDCDSKVTNIACVWSVKKGDGSQFLTTSKSELTNAMYSYDWINEGVAFYTSSKQTAGTIPVHRMRLENRHYYTSDQVEYTTLKSTAGWADEGIAFYALPPSVSSNSAHKVHKLLRKTDNSYYLTANSDKSNKLLNEGYTVETNNFSSFSGVISVPTPAPGRANVYYASSSANNFYTTNLRELESVVGAGYTYKNVLTTASSANSGQPVYRLRINDKHLYTTSSAERDSAVSKYGYVDEGIAFYLDASSSPVYRMSDAKNNKYLYATLGELMTLTNTSSWTYESPLASSQSSISPIYRFLNLQNDRHFYTINLNEALKITNKGWKYETVAFYASKSTGQSVYRLLANDKHFYTTNPNERDLAIKKYGYVYEGVAFYASEAETDKPTYRLQGGNDEYFYTASGAERDSAVNKYSYRYEGNGFYLPIAD